MPSLMKALRPPTVLNMLEDVPYWWLSPFGCSEMCIVQMFSSLVCQKFTSSVVKNRWVTELERVTKQYNFCPLISLFLLYSFRVGLAWQAIGIYISFIPTYFEHYHLHKASDHPIIFIHLIFAIELGYSIFPHYIWFCLEDCNSAALVTAKCCCDSTLLHTDNQKLFCQHHAAMFSCIMW